MHKPLLKSSKIEENLKNKNTDVVLWNAGDFSWCKNSFCISISGKITKRFNTKQYNSSRDIKIGLFFWKVIKFAENIWIEILKFDR